MSGVYHRTIHWRQTGERRAPTRDAPTDVTFGAELRQFNSWMIGFVGASLVGAPARTLWSINQNLIRRLEVLQSTGNQHAAVGKQRCGIKRAILAYAVSGRAERTGSGIVENDLAAISNDKHVSRSQ